MCDKCEYEDYIEMCNDILEDFDNEWCSNTIEGIKNWIEKNEYVTGKQKEAIENIQKRIDESENDEYDGYYGGND